ncbi:MAG TPA: hypothetical protein VK907_03800 [Phnomibacter sp.]|nr:hypothetical protein [Phnomibacter sp.]
MTPLQKRIAAIQRKVQVNPSGIFDENTTNALLRVMQETPPAGSDFQAKKEFMQRRLGFTGRDVDGLIGPLTVTRLESFFSTILPAIPQGASLITSKRSLDLIIEAEVSSKALYNNRYKNPVVPGEASGITIGIGYDIGHVTLATFEQDWKPFLTTAAFNLLKNGVGKKQQAAKAALTPAMKAITIPWETALEVFYTISMPAWAQRTRKIYPGLEQLPPDAQGALVSLVYNRGTSLSNADSRREMRNLVHLIAAGDLQGMAREIRAMKRLWSISVSPGLHKRRDREADLVANANYLMLPEEYVFI